jgi:hypothetical protein
MARVMADCRRWPSDSNCSLTIIGDEAEVIETAAQHAVSVHGHEDTQELRDQTRQLLEPEESYQMGTRPQEAMPS